MAFKDVPVDVMLRYVDDVFMQNVTMIRGQGIRFRNVYRFNLSAFNVIQSVLGIYVFCTKDYSSKGLVDFAQEIGNRTGCSTGEITGAVALNDLGDVEFDATVHMDYTPARLFSNAIRAERSYVLYVSERQTFIMTWRMIRLFWGFIVLAPFLNPRRLPLRSALALDIFAGLNR